MRLARYTRDPMTNIPTGIVVSICGAATSQTAKHRLVSKRIPGPTARAGERSVGWITEPCWHPYQRRQQQNALREESRTPLFPTWQTVRILQHNASTRPASTAHQLPGFMGLRLSLRGHFVGPISPLLLVQGATVALTVQDWTQIATSIAIT